MGAGSNAPTPPHGHSQMEHHRFRATQAALDPLFAAHLTGTAPSLSPLSHGGVLMSIALVWVLTGRFSG